MKFLFIIAHGDTTESSHAHVLAKSAQETLPAAGHEVRVVDLVKTTFKQCASPADFLKVPEGEKFSYDHTRYATVLDGRMGLAFIDAALKSNAKDGAWEQVKLS